MKTEGHSQGDDTAAARAGRCAIIGRPNVGKSTLLNALVGQKLAIATPRPGTTRTSILGVYMSKEPPTQIAFVDTPGIGHSKTALHKLLVDEAHTGMVDADVIVIMVPVPDGPAIEFPKRDKPALDAAVRTGRPVILAINKVDTLIRRDDLLPTLVNYAKAADFAAVIPISATNDINLAALITEIRTHLPEGTLYEKDFLTDKPERFFVGELIREAAIANTREEVPYGVAVLLEEFRAEPALTHIEATLVVEKDSHRGIVIGKGGDMIKRIGSDARAEIEELLGGKVFLKLWVKVIEGWTADPSLVRDLAVGEDKS